MSRPKDPNSKKHVSVTISPDVLDAVDDYRHDPKHAIDLGDGPEKPSRSLVVEDSLRTTLKVPLRKVKPKPEKKPVERQEKSPEPVQEPANPAPALEPEQKE